MSYQIAFRFIGIAVLSLFPMWATAQLKTVADDRSQVVQTIDALFNALEARNDAQFTSLLTSNFYIYDGGHRFSGQEILAFLKAQRAAGKSYNWTVSEPDVHVIGHTAWIAYVNKGRITDSSGTKDQEWLESAFLERQGTSWKIAFMHSTRVPIPTQNSNDDHGDHRKTSMTTGFPDLAASTRSRLLYVRTSHRCQIGSSTLAQ